MTELGKEVAAAIEGVILGYVFDEYDKIKDELEESMAKCVTLRDLILISVATSFNDENVLGFKVVFVDRGGDTHVLTGETRNSAVSFNE